MSGLKQGAFEMAVNRLIENIENYERIASEGYECFKSGLPDPENFMKDVSGKLDNLPSFSDVAREFANDECVALKELIKDEQAKINSCINQLRQANELQKQGENLGYDVSDKIQMIKERLQILQDQAQEKIDHTSYSSLHLNHEVYEVNGMSRDLEGEIYTMESDIHSTLSRSHDLFVEVKGQREAIDNSCVKLQERIMQIEKIARKRKENKEFAEQCAEEIGIYVSSIKSVDYERFEPKQWDGLNSDVQEYKRKMQGKDKSRCVQIGPGIVRELKEFQEKLTNDIKAFNEAETISRSKLAAAKEEIAALDLKELERWSQKAAEIRQALELLERSEKELERISKEGYRANDFNAINQMVAQVLQIFREISDLSSENHAKWEARRKLAKTVVNALNHLRYDEPDIYYEGVLENGEGDELSKLVIMAHNPANTGDVRFALTMENKTDIEVFRYAADGTELEVTQQDAVACHKAILDIGGELDAAGIQLNITDWGKAKDLPKAVDRERITWDEVDPAKSRKRLQEGREKYSRIQQEQERSRK